MAIATGEWLDSGEWTVDWYMGGDWFATGYSLLGCVLWDKKGQWSHFSNDFWYTCCAAGSFAIQIKAISERSTSRRWWKLTTIVISVKHDEFTAQSCWLICRTDVEKNPGTIKLRICFTLFYPLVNTQKAIEHGMNSEFTCEKWWCSIVLLVYQRVSFEKNEKGAPIHWLIIIDRRWECCSIATAWVRTPTTVGLESLRKSWFHGTL